MLKVGLVLARCVLGLFVSAALGFGLYTVSRLFVIGDIGAEILVLVLANGVGAGIGSYLVWFERDFKFSVHMLLLATAVVCAIIGAYFGLLRGIDVGALHPVWRAGRPETGIPIIGAVISANVPLLLLGLYRAIKNPRL